VKKFQFRLERLLRFHQQRQKQAELHLGQAASERAAALAERHRIQQQIDRGCQLNESVGGSIDPGARCNGVWHVEQLGRVLTVAQEKLKQADQRFREADRVRTEITQSVEALLHLRSQQRNEHRDEASRQQQIELDEVVMRQWSTDDEQDVVVPAGLME
jgi:flagellar export protein FliJ